MIKVVALILVSSAVAFLSGCTSALPGEPGPHIPAGTIQASLLRVDEISGMVGVSLNLEDELGEPPPQVTADPPGCAIAVGPGSRSVYLRGWSTFRSEMLRDPDNDYVVTQILGSFVDDQQAAAAFKALTDGVKGCTTAVVVERDNATSKWTYAVESANSAALGWTATQDAGEGWACYRQARLKGKVLLQAAVCSIGDGKSAATKVADLIASRVEG